MHTRARQLELEATHDRLRSVSEDSQRSVAMATRAELGNETLALQAQEMRLHCIGEGVCVWVARGSGP